MPIDPRIPLMGQPAQIPDPLESYSKLLSIKSKKQEIQDQALQTQMRQIQLNQAKRGEDTQSAAQKAIALIDSGQSEEALKNFSPGARQMAQEYLDRQDQRKAARQKLKMDDLKESASFIRSMGYDPTVAETVVGLKLKDMPEIAPVWEQIKSDPARFKQVIDHLAGPKGDEQSHELALQKTQAEIEHVKAETAKTQRPQTHVVQGIDPATGQPATLIIADEAGAVVPQPQQPQRPLVMGPGQTAVNPQTGASIAQMPPAERPPETVPVQTVDPATNENVTQFVEKKPGQSFPAPRVLASIPLAKDNQMWVWRNGKPVRVKESEIQPGDSPAKPDQADKGKEMWVWRNGAPLRVNESDIRPGDSPSKPAGAGTKNVTSADAGRLADYNTSLNELKAVKNELLATGQTGYAAKAGAMAPNIVTELTGFGAEAKAKQATIDRVKQVIGKSLEGGVLRKEDELKYTKILPTIGDPPNVVAAKLKGLETAIAQRKQEHLDALADAGYDVSRFASRAAPAPKVGDKVGRFEIVGVK